MAAFISRQPNGLLCRFSTIVDNFTHYNMTDEEYIELCAERARTQARKQAREYLKQQFFLKPFESIAKEHVFGDGTREEILNMYREMGDNDIQLEDIITQEDLIKEDEA